MGRRRVNVEWREDKREHAKALDIVDNVVLTRPLSDPEVDLDLEAEEERESLSFGARGGRERGTKRDSPLRPEEESEQDDPEDEGSHGPNIWFPWKRRSERSLRESRQREQADSQSL